MAHSTKENNTRDKAHCTRKSRSSANSAADPDTSNAPRSPLREISAQSTGGGGDIAVDKVRALEAQLKRSEKKRKKAERRLRRAAHAPSDAPGERQEVPSESVREDYPEMARFEGLWGLDRIAKQVWDNRNSYQHALNNPDSTRSRRAAAGRNTTAGTPYREPATSPAPDTPSPMRPRSPTPSQPHPRSPTPGPSQPRRHAVPSISHGGSDDDDDEVDGFIAEDVKGKRKARVPADGEHPGKVLRTSAITGGMAKKSKKDPTAPKFTHDSKLRCPICKDMVVVGTAGSKNLGQHQASKHCIPRKPPPVFGKISSMFKKKPAPPHQAALVPSLVSAPQPINAVADPSALSRLSAHLSSRRSSPTASSEDWDTYDDVPYSSRAASSEPGAGPPSSPAASSHISLDVEADLLENSPAQSSPTSAAVDLIPVLHAFQPDAFRHPAFENLRQLMESIPLDIPEATLDHPLSRFTEFSANPLAFFDMRLPEGWQQTLQVQLNLVLPGAKYRPLAAALNRGRMGLDGFCYFFEYFVVHHGFSPRLIMDKICRLEDAIQSQLTLSDAALQERYDGDLALPNLAPSLSVSSTPRVPYICNGLKVEFPPGKNEHTSYPFGLHVLHDLPWGYRSFRHSFFLVAFHCRGQYTRSDRTECSNCSSLTDNATLAGILHRIVDGVHENTPLAYHPIAQLVEIVRARGQEAVRMRLTRLNDSQRLFRVMTTIDNYKELTMAIASGHMTRISDTLESGLRNHAGVRGLVMLMKRAVSGQYKASNSLAEKSLGLLFLRLGGQRLAEIAHRALGLPSVSTLQRSTVIRPLLPSSGKPTVLEIEANIDACFDSQPDYADEGKEPQIIHLVLMLDEIAVERRVRYDDRINKAVGVCRKHCEAVPLLVNTVQDLYALRDGIKEGRAHLPGEATVAGVGALHRNPRIYSVRPYLFSADCKVEDGPEHAAAVLRPLLTAINNKSVRGSTTFRVVSVASDGESRRGHAFSLEYMKQPLAEESPIYSELGNLPLMNLLVGADDMTPDKDAKHGIKCLSGLAKRDAGIEIVGFTITVSILKDHLSSNGDSLTTINAFLNPYDRQHVFRSFGLLRAIWNLPDAPAGSTPSFARARRALQIFGRLAYHIVMPYICVDLDLDEQLTYLSTAAHMLLDLYTQNNAQTRFMPVQTFVNLMIMIKNAYFCVAKTKADIPEGNFWLILLGTDRLELFFGLIRTAIGTDSNVDLLQLASRGTNLTEIAVILSENPEWDRTPRRISLPGVGKNCTELNSKVDHINPDSWKGNTSVARVSSITCWTTGRKVAEDILAGSRERFAAMEKNSDVNMLAPFGTLLVKQYASEDIEAAYSCTNLAAEFPPPVAEPAGPIPDPSYSGDGDLEDAMAVEEPRGGFDAYIEFEGKRITKSKALRLVMAEVTGPRASTDRTKRVASMASHGRAAGSLGLDNSDSDQILGARCLRGGSPICTLVRCEEQFFLAIGSVNGLTLGSEPLDEMSIDLVPDATTMVAFQVLRLVRATVADDPTKHNDWCWSLAMDGRTLKAPGRLVYPINPALSTSVSGEPSYLFKSSELMAIAVSLHDLIIPQIRRDIPDVVRSPFFPYRDEGATTAIGFIFTRAEYFQGRACFLCEDDVNERLVAPEGSAACTDCNPAVLLDLSQGQRVLEHCAAHILHDKRLNDDDQLCGLCLRPSPQCVFYLRKGQGMGSGPQIDLHRSTCARLIKLQYSTAAISNLPGSPCSNVPIICVLCGIKAPAIWRYNLARHYRTLHRLTLPTLLPVESIISAGEKQALQVIWSKRHQVVKRRNVGKSKEPLAISEQHSSRLALRISVKEALKTAEPTSTPPPGLSEYEPDEDDTFFEPQDNNSSQSASPALASLADSDSELEQDLFFHTLEASRLELPADVEQDTSHTSTSAAAAGPSVTDLIDSRPHSAASWADVSDVEVEEPELKRTRGVKRKAIQFGCDGCGRTLTEEEQENTTLAVKCANKACPTQWFHRDCMKLQHYVPKAWTCESCPKAGKRARD
ncbi:hypothetical protein GGX14DRAFT_701343 [Mycena pura]|uniref:PHD-type domain-containing protein n=1 Tax=Mycena pura TaxID=153505 RepID=A0AAD6XZV2_9AGAR|nr:hypothetical protein GGX14DRAFT_701343 [Mycena pura]